MVAASPTDKLTSTQFSHEEMVAFVQEANAVGTYVSAHAYTTESIIRALDAGVSCIEHGNRADAPVLRKAAACNATLVPTLVTYAKLVTDGEGAGMPSDLVAKVGSILDDGLQALRAANDVGCRVVFVRAPCRILAR